MDFSILARRLLGLQSPPSGEPNAYSRITRTPIHISPETEVKGTSGLYYPEFDAMAVGHDYAQPGRSTIPHESAHSIYLKSGLQRYAPEIAQRVPQEKRALINIHPELYDQTPDTMANEGLGYSVGDPDATEFINYTAGKIQNPQLRQMLLRLHNNRVAAQKVGGIGTR